MKYILALLLTVNLLNAEPLGTVSSFSFPDSNNKNFSSSELKDKIWIASFFFTSCQGICPMINNRLSGIYQNFKINPKFAIVSFTVDPKVDTPLKLKSYSAKFKADPKIWHFLHSDAAELRKLMTASFKLVSFDDPNLHSTRLVLIKGEEIIGYYNGLDIPAYENLNQALQKELR